jgi:hypothetical protein
MERKISSSFTEFYKVYGVVSIFIFVLFFAVPFSIFLNSPFYILVILGLINLFTAFDFWRMKEVEMTDSGLLISSRLFFKQKTIFVPYEKIESSKNKLWWLGNNKRISIKFKENTDFGKEISFISKGFTLNSQTKIVEELNRAIIQNRNAERLNSAFLD